MDLTYVIRITLIGLLAGTVGTGSGGLITFVSKKPGSFFLSAILGFAGGIMLDVTFLELIPESINQGGFFYCIVGLVGGIAVFMLLEYILPHEHDYFGAGDHQNNHFQKMGILLGLGIALHNIPEGLAIGAGYASSDQLGLELALIMGIHNLPEGVAIAVALDAGGCRKSKTMLITALAGLPMAAGAFIGAMLGIVSPLVLSVSLGFAAGAMLFVTCDELIPNAQNLARGHSATLGFLLGVVTGILIISF